MLYDNYLNILLSTNFVGGAGQNDLSTITASGDQSAGKRWLVKTGVPSNHL